MPQTFQQAAVGLTLLVAGIASTRAEDAQTIEEGHRIALQVCALCHIVAADQSRAPLLKPPAPSFADVVERQDATQDWLRDFLAHPHGELRRESIMPPFVMSPSQIDAVVAYLLSLKRR